MKLWICIHYMYISYVAGYIICTYIPVSKITTGQMNTPLSPEYAVRVQEICALPQGWYEQGWGEPTSKTESDITLNVLRLLSVTPNMQMPLFINPVPEGGISLEWKDFDVTISEDHVFSYLKREPYSSRTRDYPLNRDKVDFVMTEIQQWYKADSTCCKL